VGTVTHLRRSSDLRWKAVCVYRTGNGPVDIDHLFEEIADLHDLIERGPHWDTLISCTITLNRPAEDDALTVEKAERL
jgi:hypothetical protein